MCSMFNLAAIRRNKVFEDLFTKLDLYAKGEIKTQEIFMPVVVFGSINMSMVFTPN